MRLLFYSRRTLACILCGILFYAFCTVSSSHAHAPQALFESAYTLPPSVIKELAETGLKKGSRRMGKELSKHIKYIPSEPAHIRQKIIEDAYL